MYSESAYRIVSVSGLFKRKLFLKKMSTLILVNFHKQKTFF